jgi:hypothetical protein
MGKNKKKRRRARRILKAHTAGVSERHNPSANYQRKKQRTAYEHERERSG